MMKEASMPYRVLSRTKNPKELILQHLKHAGFNVEKQYSKTYDEKTKNMIYRQEE